MKVKKIKYSIGESIKSGSIVVELEAVWIKL